MASNPELLDGPVTLEVECRDRLCLNGYLGPRATSGGLITFMREQLGKPIPSPVVPGQRLVRDYPLEPLTLEEASGCLTGGTAPQDGITRPAQVVIPYGIVTFGEALARGETARCHFAAKLKEAG